MRLGLLILSWVQIWCSFAKPQAATSRANNRLITCFDDSRSSTTSRSFVDYPNSTTTSINLCCILVESGESVKDQFDIRYFISSSSKGLENEYSKTKTDPYCHRQESQLACCCTEDYCNNQNFAAYHLDRIRTKDFGSPLIGAILSFAVSLLLAVGTVALVIFIGNVTCYQKHLPAARQECMPMCNIDLRGIIIEPAASSQEMEAIIEQIKSARHTDAPEAVPLKKLHFRSVTTFSTVDELTIREPAPVEFPALTSNNPCLEMLCHMIKAGPREIKFDPTALLLCYDKALEALKKEPILAETVLPAQIYGDLHGQYSDLIRWFRLNGWPPTTRCIFMGDYVDRGRHSLEVITMLLCMKTVMPNDVFVNRGNHEDAVISRNYSFYAECINRLTPNYRLNQQVFDKLAQVFAHLPLATKLNDKILCLHGGLSPKLVSWQSISGIKRPIMNLTPGSLACDLTWSDPDRKTLAYLVNYKRDKKNGIGYLFGLKQVDQVCKDLDIKMIFRGHQAPMNGYEMFGAKMLTVFSAPGYRGVSEEANFGGSVHIDSRGNIDIVRVGVSLEVRRERNRQKLDKGDGYLAWHEIKDKPLDDDEERSY